MEKSCHSSGGGDSISTVSSAASTKSRNTSTSDIDLKHLNKLSHKISKPNRPQPSPPIHPPRHDLNRPHQPTSTQSQPLITDNNHPMAAPPPVYTINKNDFRDVVQRLTGSQASSPARERFSSPPPPQPKSKPSSSRLQKIRPPPLAQISNRPPNMLNCLVDHSQGSFFGGQRQPLSPLPPFPTVHAAAESPVSAYMCFLENSFSLFNGTDLKKFPIGPSRWNNVAPPLNLHYPRCNNAVSPQNNVGSPRVVPPRNNLLPSRWSNTVQPWNNETPQLAQNPPPSSPAHQPQQNTCTSLPAFPLSPLPFGSLLPSPSMLFSPAGQLGFPQLALSPTLPVPSPRWRGDY